MRVEDIVADELEDQDFIVIRTYRKGCPDVIAFPASIASSVLAIEVKGPGDNPRPEQRKIIEYLKNKNVNACFHHIKHNTKDITPANLPKTVRGIWWKGLSREDKQYWSDRWLTDGFRAYPKEEGRGVLYYEHKGQWEYGWYKASQEADKKEASCQRPDLN
jgi:hypothetical protein